MMRVRFSLLSLLFVIIGAIGHYTGPVKAEQQKSNTFAPQSNWHYSDRTFRLPIMVTAGGESYSDKIVELPVDFTQLLTSVGQSGAFEPDSLQLIEVDNNGNLIDDAVPFQFDQAQGYNATTKATGTLVLQLKSLTTAGTTRSFQLYFDMAGNSFTPPTQLTQVSVSNNNDEGLASYRITTANGVYYYQKTAAGFSSLVDGDGNDWISYQPTGGAGGNYRGIPNMIYPEGQFHPGATGATSTLRNKGPLKVTIRSVTTDGKWESLWDIFPTHARMTLLKADHTYWFLYEGTPGGSLDQASDFVMRSNGTQTSAATPWTGDLSTPEWVYVADPVVNRSLFVINHTDDTAVDSYYPMSQASGSMTVLGFGRENTKTLMNTVPATFTIGLMDTVDLASATTMIDNAYHTPEIATGAVDVQENAPTATPQPTATTAHTPTLTPTATETPTPTPTFTPTATVIPSFTPSFTPTQMPTQTPTEPPAPFPSATATLTETPQPISTATATLLPSPTVTGALPTATATATSVATPTAQKAEINMLSAERNHDGVLITWETNSEVGSVGFYLYRAIIRTPTGEGRNEEDIFAPISALIPSQGTEGGLYELADVDVVPQQMYNYLLVEKRSDGTLVRHEDFMTVVGTNAVDYQLFVPLVSN